MDLVTLLVGLIIIALIYWVLTLLPMPQVLRTIIIIVLILIVVLWVFGGMRIGLR